MQLHTIHVLIVILVGLLLVLYVVGKMRTQPNAEIVQVSLSNLTDDMILEKNLIVIDDNVVSCNQVIESAFRFLYVSKDTVTVSSGLNNYQYMIFHNDSDLVNSVVVADRIEIRLYPGNILILPWRWKYQLKKDGLQMVGLHSITSYAISALHI